MDSCGCFAWCTNAFWSPIPICLWRTLRFIVWVIWQIISFIITIITIICTIIASIYPIITYFVLVMLLCWLWWFLYPLLEPFVSTVGVDLVNVLLELFVICWNIGILLWNMAVQIWNAAVPLIGMVIYIVMELVITIMNKVMTLLGEINVYALFKPLMEILESLVKILVEVIQALVSVAIPLIEAMAKIIGAIIQVVFAVVQALWPVVQWVLETLFKLLEPVLQIVIDMVGFFLNLFAAAGMMQRSLLSLEDLEARSGGSRGPFDQFHYTAYGNAYSIANKYWGRKTYQKAKMTEAAEINRIVAMHPARSFDYYWTVHRPYLQTISYSTAAPIYKGAYEGPMGDSGGPSRGARTLLSLARKRNLLSLDEMKELQEPAVSHDEYWKRFDDSPEDHIEWYKQLHYGKEQRKRDIVQSVQRKLLDLSGDQLKHPSSELDDESLARSLHRQLLALEDEAPSSPPPEKRSPFEGELHKKVLCKGLACGGHGKILDHPVHKLREMSWARKTRPYEGSRYRDPGQSEQEYVITLHFLYVSNFSYPGTTTRASSLSRRGRKRCSKPTTRLGGTQLSCFIFSVFSFNFSSRYAQHPVLKRHARDFWNRTTGHEDLHSWYENVHARYGNFYEFVHDKFWDFSD